MTVVDEDATEVKLRPLTIREKVLGGGEVSRTPTLTQTTGPEPGKGYPLNLGSRAIFIGRDEAASIMIDDASVSRRHARLYLEGSGAETSVVIQDLDSTNGTFVNRKQVQRSRLRHGDRIHLGDVLLRFEMLDPVDKEVRDTVARRVKESDLDSLTRLLTRRGMVEHLPSLLKRAAENNWAVSAVMLDIDHFKRVNDSLGHQAGDEVLRKIGGLVRNTVRGDDLAIRFGGEEILLILAGARRLHARVLSERFRDSVALMTFPDQPDLKVTVSLGVAERADGESIEAWIGRADKALYRAKRGGRNRSEAAPMPDEES
jgi:diguanylate cyclase (GGDEF)-like protein